MDIAELSMLLETLQAKSVSQEEFDQAAEKSKGFTNLNNDQKLQLYGLFKQGTIGNVNSKRPWGIDMVGCAKWDAWKSYEGWPKENAALAYVYIVDNVLSTPPEGSASASSEGMGPTVSTLKDAHDTTKWPDEEIMFQFTVDDDCENLKTHISQYPTSVSQLNEETKMSALHYAADRGFIGIANILLDAGADIDAQDCHGYTPLMCAAASEQEEMIGLLLSRGANVQLTDEEGLNVTQFTDNSDGVNQLLASHTQSVQSCP